MDGSARRLCRGDGQGVSFQRRREFRNPRRTRQVYEGENVEHVHPDRSREFSGIEQQDVRRLFGPRLLREDGVLRQGESCRAPEEAQGRRIQRRQKQGIHRDERGHQARCGAREGTRGCGRMIDLSRVLAGLPKALRDTLLESFQEIMSNYLERRWEPSELNGGKFCEVVYSIINGALKGSFPTSASKPANMRAACRALESEPPDASRVGDRSLRLLIPRVLPVLYEVRNNRGVGHVGGDVTANHMDAEFVQAMASWIMAELVRIFHGVTTEEAQQTVDALIERKSPIIWDV